MIVENKSGAGGNIATEYVARSKPDGYTIYVHAATAVAANQHLFKKPPVDAGKAIQIAASINRQPFMLVVDAKSPYKTVADLTAAMKPKGEKATYAYAAPTGNIMGEIYKNVTGIKAVEVAYKTAPDSLNECSAASSTTACTIRCSRSPSSARDGCAFSAVSTATRLQANPDMPTMTEQGVPMDLTGWWAAMLPAGTPKPIVDKVNQWFTEIVKTEETKKFLNSFGGDQFFNTPEAGSGAVPQGDRRLGQLRAHRQDRAARLKPPPQQ